MTEFLFWAAAVPIILFPIMYAVVAPWWRTPAGRQSMALGLALLALVMISVLNRIIGHDYPGRHLLHTGALAFAAVVLWWRLVLLVRVQIHARSKES